MGASGAVFGVYGALLSLYLRRRDLVPPTARRQMIRGIGTFVLLNLAFGLAVPAIDQAAHVGGLVSGVLSGLLLDPRGAVLVRIRWAGPLLVSAGHAAIALEVVL